MQVTMTDIAHKLGISQSTVSMVLNGKDKGRVSKKKADLIRETALGMGYQTNLAAVSLRNKKSYIISILLPSLRDSFYGGLVGDLEHLLSSTEYIANFTFWETAKEAEKKVQNALSRQTAAIITSEPRFLPDQLTLPVVSYATHDKRFDCVSYDHVQSIRLCIDYLIHLGHRKIAYLVERKGDPRSAAFLKIITEMNLSHISQNMEPIGDYFMVDWDEIVINRFDNLWDGLTRPTAILTQNDATAMLVLRRAWERGIKIPEELSVIGADNIHQSAISIPSLTTVDNFPNESAASLMLEMLFDRIDTKDLPKQNHIAQGKLIQRESCAPPNKDRSLT